MLTNSQYLALRKYKESFTRPTKKPDVMTESLFKQGFIRLERSEYTTNNVCEVTHIKTFWTLTSLGEKAMEEFEDHINQMSKMHAEKKADRKFQLLNTFFGAVLGVIGALLVEHFAAILEFFHRWLS